MKKLAILLIAMAFIVSSAPLFAGEGAAAKGSKQQCVTVKLPFQQIADTMKLGPGKEKNKLIKPEWKQHNVFQDHADEIKSSSATAEVVK